MKIKNVVKVMNFHSLLHVDSARKRAALYFKSELELTKMISRILYNRNLILDKKTLKPNPKEPILDIYIGNDYGFCGDFNSSINDDMENHPDNYKIIIGKKMHNIKDKVLLKIDKDNFANDFNKIESIIHDSIMKMSYREINVVYNHYHSINSFSFVRKTLFPVVFQSDNESNYNEDFVVETDANEMLINLVTLYICYEIRMAETNSWAAENVMRQQITHESLKKIDEFELEKAKTHRKIKKYKDFKKIIENHRKKGMLP